MNEHSAQQAYKARRDRINDLMRDISEQLDDHRNCFDADGNKWSYVGDLASIDAILMDLKNRLSGV